MQKKGRAIPEGWTAVMAEVGRFVGAGGEN